MKNKKLFLPLLALILAMLTACGGVDVGVIGGADGPTDIIISDGTQDAPQETGLPTAADYTGEPYVVVNGNEPYFTSEEITDEGYETFADLDLYGRCGVTEACVGKEMMPTADRESISHVYPSGWVNRSYDFVDGKYLYNRCHLIGFQLTGENDNERNLITGTRYMNVQGMLPFENMVADYVKETGNHVMYRVTPVYEGDNLVAEGVLMEAYSVEDEGEGVLFCVFCFNVQPGVIIDYETGENEMDETAFAGGEEGGETGEYVLNVSSKKFHLPDCSGARDMKKENRQDYSGSREMLLAQGFDPCGSCDP